MGVGGEELVAHTPGRAGGERLPCSGIAEPGGLDADRGAAEWEQRAQVADATVEHRRVADDDDVGAADAGVHPEVGELGGRRAGAHWRGSGRGDRRTPPITNDFVARRVRAPPGSPSSRSVASLAAGWRSSVAPGGDRGVDRGGRRRSRSRRRRRRRRIPSACACSTPESAAITSVGGGQVARSKQPTDGSPPANTNAIRELSCIRRGRLAPCFPPPALPGSGSRGRRRVTVALSARLTRAPRDSLVLAHSSAGGFAAPGRVKRSPHADRPTSPSCSFATVRPSGAAPGGTRRSRMFR